MKQKNKNGNRNVAFLYEVSTLRFIQRTGRNFLNADFQNLAEHHFRVTWIALLLARLEGITNTEKIMKMAMVHDIAESRTGDVNYLQRQYVVRNEKLAVEDMFSQTALKDEFLALWNEYEKRKSIESKIVKDADNLDVDISLKEQEAMGSILSKKWFEHREKIVKNTLFTKSAKELFDDIWKSNPHDWHLHGRNRLNDGDWKT